MISFISKTHVLNQIIQKMYHSTLLAPSEKHISLHRRYSDSLKNDDKSWLTIIIISNSNLNSNSNTKWVADVVVEVVTEVVARILVCWIGRNDPDHFVWQQFYVLFCCQS